MLKSNLIFKKNSNFTDRYLQFQICILVPLAENSSPHTQKTEFQTPYQQYLLICLQPTQLFNKKTKASFKIRGKKDPNKYFFLQ